MLIIRILTAVFLMSIAGCGIEREASTGAEAQFNDPIIDATIDSMSIFQVKRFVDQELPSIYDYYKMEEEDYVTWCEPMFGRCCSNTDLSFTENLFMKIIPKVAQKEHLESKISDAQYLTAFSFDSTDSVEFELQLDLEDSYLKGEHSNKELLKEDDVIMDPIRIRLINGNVQSEEAFLANGRVKELDLFLNGKYIQTVRLLDTPLIQLFEVHAVFKTYDTIKLVPKTSYNSEAQSICIAEIQSNLGSAAVQGLNDRFKFYELMNQE